MSAKLINEDLIKTAIIRENGIELLDAWLEIAKQEFITQIRESKNPGVIGPAVLSRDAITKMQKDGLPVIKDALIALNTKHQLYMTKIEEDNVPITIDTKEKIESDKAFCKFMLGGK